MNGKNWSPEELALLDGLLSDAQIAAKLGRSIRSVSSQRWARKKEVSSVRSIPVETPYDSDQERATNRLWQSKYAELRKKYDKALTENSVIQQLVAEITDLAPRSYSPMPAVYLGRPDRPGTPQSAVLLFSDTHVGQVVRPDQTLGFGEYNFDVFLARLKYMEESVVSILDNHTTTEIDELVVAMLGDMLHGCLNHSAEAAQRNTLFSQFYMAGHAIAQSLRIMATHVPKIRIKTVVGNHPRWQNQHKMPTDNRYSNLDQFLYALVEALTRDITNIEWDLNTQPFAIFEVQGFTFHAAHGDHLRGGDKALGIPNHSIAREISTKTQLFSKFNRPVPNYYVCGHLHRDIKLPHAFGDVTINGGFPGIDGFGLTSNFNPVDPKQLLFFVHPKYGKTAEYNLTLKFAEVGDHSPYCLPRNFPIE